MKPWLIAHRGANDEAPENSRSAFDRALQYPVDGMEFYVQMTADGQLVLYHDRTLSKIMGRRKRISDLTFEQLKGLPWGRHRPEFAYEPLLTLRENLDLYASRTRLMVEIKSRKHDRESGRSSETTLKVVKELERPEIQKHAENIFILSFDPDVLKLGFEHAPQYKYVLNVSDEPGGPTGYESIVERPSSETGHLFALCAAVKNLSEPLVQFCHGNNKLAMTYVCNSPKQLRRATGFGVDAVMTDKPGWLTGFFKC